MGIDHQYIPPHEQSLNEAEKVCDQIWAAARALLHRSNAANELFPYAVDYAMYVDLRMATTSSRNWLTPYEMIKGVPPTITHMRPFYTSCAVKVPKSRRQVLEKKGDAVSRAEMGRFIGFQGAFSTTPKLLLSSNRVVHSINVTYDISNYSHPGLAPVSGGEVHEESDSLQLRFASDPGATTESRGVFVERVKPNQEFGSPATPLPHPDMYEWEADASPEWMTHAGEPAPRPRPKYVFLCKLNDIVSKLDHDTAVFDASLEMAIRDFDRKSAKPDVGTHLQASGYLALHAQKDLSWKEALASKDRDKVIKALQSESDSLQSTILTLLDEDHPDYKIAVETATPGRWLLDIKRDGSYKVRGVKQGFREDKETADGPDFNYYAHVAKLVTVRTALFRHNRGMSERHSYNQMLMRRVALSIYVSSILSQELGNISLKLDLFMVKLVHLFYGNKRWHRG